MGLKSPRVRKRSPAQRALEEGYRSGLEEKIADRLEKDNVPFAFEPFRISFTPPTKQRTYLPDFVLDNGIVVETKGRFTTEDRQRHKHIKAEHPDLDIRFVFSRASTRLTKVSNTTYAMWCDQYGFKWANETIPKAWLEEPKCAVRLAALKRAAIPKPKQRPRKEQL